MQCDPTAAGLTENVQVMQQLQSYAGDHHFELYLGIWLSG